MCTTTHMKQRPKHMSFSGCNFPNNMSTKASLVEQLSKVIVESFVSTFQSNKQSTNASHNTSLVCGQGT